MYGDTNLIEKRLLVQLRDGDVKAFEQLYFSYSARIFGNILKMVKSVEIAEEILQDLFQRIWEKRTSIEPDKSFKSYLFTIAKHLVYDFFNQQTKRHDIEAYLIAASSELYHHIDEELAYKESETIIAQAVDHLPPQRKLVYTLCKIDGKSYEEVSYLLGISVSTISDHIVKATKFLKAYYLSEHALLVLLLTALFP